MDSEPLKTYPLKSCECGYVGTEIDWDHSCVWWRGRNLRQLAASVQRLEQEKSQQEETIQWLRAALREHLRAGFLAHPDPEAERFAWNFGPGSIADDREQSAWDAYQAALASPPATPATILECDQCGAKPDTWGEEWAGWTTKHGEGSHCPMDKIQGCDGTMRSVPPTPATQEKP